MLSLTNVAWNRQDIQIHFQMNLHELLLPMEVLKLSSVIIYSSLLDPETFFPCPFWTKDIGGKKT